MKRIFSLALAGVLLLGLLTGCSSKPSATDDIAEGEKIISLMQEILQNEDYVTALYDYSVIESDTEYWELLTKTDFNEAIAVYRLQLPANILEMASPMYEFKPSELSPTLKADLEEKMIFSFSTRIGFLLGGSNSIVINSALGVSDSFVQTGRKTADIYFYMFENDIAVAVTMAPTNQDIVKISGTLIKNLPYENEEGLPELEKILTEYDVLTYVKLEKVQ